MDKVCSQCAASFEITDGDLAFYEKVSPVIGGKKYPIPPPTLCPDCRQQRRLVWRNERNLYRRTCDQCNKSIISIYPKASPFTVFCPDCWWSDTWDSRDFGQEMDFGRPLFEQMRELQEEVPRLSLNIVSNENSEYINLSGYNKNCYLLFAAEYNEDCHYGTQVIKSTGCVDAFDCYESRYCYEVVDAEKCHSVLYSQNVSACSESLFLFDCRGCAHCILCTNMRNQKYCIRNQQMQSEAFAAEKKRITEEIAKGKFREYQEEFASLKRTCLHRAADIVNCENVTGDYLKNSHNLRTCFDVSYGEDCTYVYTGFQVKDLGDVCHTTEAELGYDSLSLGYGSYNTAFTHGSWSAKNLLYCDIIQSGSDMMGCVSMKPGKYCILNKQYTKERYENFVPKVIAHMQETKEWGEFFPVTLSPFAYNETNAQLYYPLSEVEVLQHGWRWHKPEDSLSGVKKTILAAKLPASIENIPDDVLNWAITCEETRRPFRIIKQELEFYRKMKLPIPHFHPDERHKRRMALRNPRVLWQRKCGKCGKEVQTTYAPDRPEIVYCEACYLAEVY
ncbi:hypothetical protein A2454_00700 [Candidatus Peribacteria bacterium RIFOXYC2_FULL_55_14]|nr:MAG: hypothetical protein UY85_C0003G0014 [Candidatus Peribacteria bacterium GW2011_GWB1_54_5]KKW39558.1 MAG: hypothetical protein UY87_C0041G0011 [Candidatus Peribacteria bacterium GW2011_GWC2_54_8]OGJ71600.1 MAG: hypothetical protein A2198_05360 [Candidatus Peribacteria bacterium RIFOXYA1_FULL_56_14]OGJ72994.1 MAG: hypothetical protein A2217_06870 [Candidatus Peribacteria bacterium RIFOXYA2_FULL_55_28]OGJ73983.1 MAG: hypothetical protein A2384_05140 [Candidatus Peribacteria bacterium RIFOX